MVIVLPDQKVELLLFSDAYEHTGKKIVAQGIQVAVIAVKDLDTVHYPCPLIYCSDSLIGEDAGTDVEFT